MNYRNRVQKLERESKLSTARYTAVIRWFYEPGAAGTERTGRAVARLLGTGKLIEKETSETEEQFISRIEAMRGHEEFREEIGNRGRLPSRLGASVSRPPNTGGLS